MLLDEHYQSKFRDKPIVCTFKMQLAKYKVLHSHIINIEQLYDYKLVVGALYYTNNTSSNILKKSRQ